MMDIRLLGRFQIMDAGQAVETFSSPRLQLLLTYLLLNRQEPQPRELVAAALWSDVSDSQARNNLRRLLHRLRQQLPHADSLLEISAQTIQWQPQISATIDIVQFKEASLLAGDLASWQNAADLYAGELLPGHYDAWLVAERVLLEQQWLECLDQITRYAQAEGELELAIQTVRQLLANNPLREEHHRTLMQLFYDKGDRAAALQAYDDCYRYLMDELGVPPGPVTRALHLALVSSDTDQGGTPDLPASQQTEIKLDLPTPTTPFIGRAVEIARIEEAYLEESAQLVTIVGIGGVGKTRLAIEVAHRMGSHLSESFAFVPLAQISSADLLVTSVASAVGLNFAGSVSLEQQLLDFLRDREIGLVLDNFEHLMVGRSLIERIMANSPACRLLITSRERLNLGGERVVDLSGLPLSRTDSESLSISSKNRVELSDAATLFMATARHQLPAFSPSEAELAAIEHICLLCGGLPLAIELAAAWVRLLSCTEIATRLANQFSLLHSERADLPDRQRSIMATFDYSWELLNQAEQLILPQLAVFQGPFSAKAVLSILTIVEATLLGFVDKSLLRRQGTSLFDLHPLLAQFIGQRWQLLPEFRRDIIRQRHADYYISLTAELAPIFEEAWRAGQIPLDAIRRLRPEIDNIRVSWRHLCQTPDWLDALSVQAFIDAFGRFLVYQSWPQEAVDLYQNALLLWSFPETTKSRWLRRLGESQMALGDLQNAEESLLRSVATAGFDAPADGWRWQQTTARQLFVQLVRQLSTVPPIDDADEAARFLEAAQSYDVLGRVYYYGSNGRKSALCALTAVNLAERLPPSGTLARTYANLCLGMALARQHRLARRYRQRARAVAAQIDHVPDRAHALRMTAVYDGMVGHWEAAESALLEAMQVYERLGDQQQWGECYAPRMMHRFAQGRYREASEHWNTMLASARGTGNRIQEAWGISGQGSCLVMLGQPLDALPHLQAARVIVDDLNFLQGQMTTTAFVGLAHLQLSQWSDAWRAVQQINYFLEQGEPTFITALSIYRALCEITTGLLHVSSNRLSSLGLSQNALNLQLQRSVRLLQRQAVVAPVGQARAELYTGIWAHVRGQNRLAKRHFRKAIQDARRMAVPYDEARAAYELATRFPLPRDQQALLELAHDRFRMIGAQYELGLVERVFDAAI